MIGLRSAMVSTQLIQDCSQPYFLFQNLNIDIDSFVVHFSFRLKVRVKPTMKHASHVQQQQDDSFSWPIQHMQAQLERRKRQGNLRRLTLPPTVTTPENNQDDDISMDFSSNDYLGLAQSPRQYALVEDRLRRATNNNSARWLGATGSRLLSGNSRHAQDLEAWLAHQHGMAHGLLCNSGYDANLSVVSSLPCDIVVCDEYIHNSIHMGLRLWQAASPKQQQQPSTTKRPPSPRTVHTFRHNHLPDLEQKLKSISQQHPSHSFSSPRIIILVESVYSMDGDQAPLPELLDLAYRYDAAVVVDEAHGLGVYGREPGEEEEEEEEQQQSTDDDQQQTRRRSTNHGAGMGLLAHYGLTRHPALLAAVFTFGKAAGCHGAVACANHATVREYWINFAYPLIYSTALPSHSLVTIRVAYETMMSPHGHELRWRMRYNVQFFRRLMQQALNAQTTSTTNSSDGSSCALRPLVTLLPADNDNHPNDRSPIQAVCIAGGNTVVTQVCQRLQEQSGIVLYPIKSPTVPAGQERIRIILHAHNTPAQVGFLCQMLCRVLQEMGLLTTTTRSTKNDSGSELSSSFSGIPSKL